MSLFDVIKYPISFPPTVEELEALPTDLYKKFIIESRWGDGRTNSLPSKTYIAWGIASRLQIVGDTREDAEKDIIILRRLIQEYNEPV